MELAVLSAWFLSTAVLRIPSGDPKDVLRPWGEHLRAPCPRVWASSPHEGPTSRVGVRLTMMPVAEQGAIWRSRCYAPRSVPTLTGPGNRRAEEQPDIARDASHADNPCQCYSSRGRLARARPHPKWTT